MTISKEQFRSVMGRFASGVTIVTTNDTEKQPWGMTVSAFSSLSLDPPLALVCIDSRSSCLDTMRRAGCFAVNILSAGQQDVSTRFATNTEDRFAEIQWQPGGAMGCPILDGCAASMECELHEVLPGGDHQIVLGKLVDAHVTDAQPLLYWSGDYANLVRNRQ